MNPPTHEEISQRALSLWQERGCPAGQDTTIWLDAERQLQPEEPARTPEPAAAKNPESFGDRVKAEMAAESVVEHHITPAGTEQKAIRAALQKQDARAPQVPTHPAPKVTTPVSGKPLYPKNHSS